MRRASRRIRLTFAILACFASGCSSPGDDAARAIERWAPGTSAEDGRVLAHGTDADWHALADRRGDFPFYHAARGLLDQDQLESPEAWDEWLRQTGPILERLARFTERRFNCGGISRSLEQIREGGYGGAVAWRQILGELRSLAADSTLTNEQRVASATALLPSVDRLPVVSQRAHVRSWMSDRYGDAGMTDKRMPLVREAYRLFEKAESHHMMCQLLGVIGAAGGLEDSDKPPIWYWHEGRRIAYEHETWGQWARLTTFLSRYYSRRGDLERALQMVSDVLARLDQVDIGRAELRHLSACAQFYTRLRCHDMARRVAQRIEVVLETHSDVGDRPDRADAMFAGMALASVLMDSGRWMSADSLYSSIAATYDPQVVGVPPYYPFWMEGLNANGQYARTLAVYAGAESRLRRHDRFNASLYRFKADAELALGQPDSAAVSLAEFDRVLLKAGASPASEMTHRDHLVVRTIEALEGGGAARVAAIEAFRRLERRVSDMSPASQGYLWLDVNDGLRFSLHALAGDDRLMRYGIELIWRDLYRLLGSGRPPHGEDVFSRATRRARETMASLDGVVHCLYVVENPKVWRFTATRNSIHVDTLSVAVNALSKSAGVAWEIMARDPGDDAQGPGPDLTLVLSKLSHALLPPGMKRRSERRLLITGDGFLRRLPFETLNLGDAGSYVPLASVFDVAGVRSTGASVNPTPGGTLIIVAPDISARSARRLGRVRDLPGARLEAERAASVLPEPTTVLAGSGATRIAIRGAWERSEFIYVAAHVVQDPQVPFLTLLPLASGDDQIESYLTILDVRRAHLSRCEMVVLSGCATGAPYVEATISGASLGDAFIDSGTRAAIQTHWNVRDDRARETMGAFLDEWDANGRDPVAALGEVRRGLIQKYPHPHYWAAYAISGHIERVRLDSR